jgi:hypothetical protein
LTTEAAVDVQSPVIQAVARLSDRALARLVGANAYLRGRVYARQSCVHALAVAGSEASGRVHGRASDPYDVKVNLSDEGGLTSNCTCPAWRGADRHCKHVAALLVALRDKVRPPRSQQAGGEGVEGEPGAPASPSASAAPTPAAPRPPKPKPAEHARDRDRDRGDRDRDRHDRRDAKGQRRRDDNGGSAREVVVMDRSGPRVVSAGGMSTVQSVSASASAQNEQPRGFGAWVASNDPRKAPEVEYRIHVRSNSLAITPYLAESRTAIAPADALDQLGALPSVHRPILRLLSRLHPKGARGAQVEARGEDAAELVAKLRGRRVLVEPMLMELRYLDEPLVPRIELEMVPPSHVRVRIVFERKSGDARRFNLNQGLWLEGDPGWHLDPIQGVARPLADHVTSTWLERLLKTPAVTHPTSDVARLLSEHLPKVSLALNAPLPDIRAIVDEIDVAPKFVLRAAGDLTRVVGTLDVKYGEHEFVVPPVELPPPLVILESSGLRPKCLRRDVGAERLAVNMLLDGGLEVTDDFRAFQATEDRAVKFWSERRGRASRLASTGSRSTWSLAPRAAKPQKKTCAAPSRWGTSSCASKTGRTRASKVCRCKRCSLACKRSAKGQRRQLPLSQAGRVQDPALVPGARVEPRRRTSSRRSASTWSRDRRRRRTSRPRCARTSTRASRGWRSCTRRSTGGAGRRHGSRQDPADDRAAACGLKEEPPRRGPPRRRARRRARRRPRPERSLGRRGRRRRREREGRAKKGTKKVAKKAPGADAPAPIRGGTDGEAAEGRAAHPGGGAHLGGHQLAARGRPLRAVAAGRGVDRARPREAPPRARHADVVITSYALLRRDEEFLQKYEFAYVILDEAQNIKNPLSATARAAKKLRSAARLALTGTPIENRLSEIWSIFDFLSPGMLGDLATFEERYARPIDRGDVETPSRRLRGVIHPLVLRRTKSEVAKDLPARIVVERECETSRCRSAPSTSRCSSRCGERVRRDRPRGHRQEPDQILAGLTRLRQAACDPRLLKLPGTSRTTTTRASSTRCGRSSGGDPVGHRTLVFSQFVEMLSLIRKALERDGV